MSLENFEQSWRIAFEQQISEAARTILLAPLIPAGDVRHDPCPD